MIDSAVQKTVANADAGVARADVTIGDVMQMVIGIGKIPTADPRQSEHIVRVALDGLRYRPQR